MSQSLPPSITQPFNPIASINHNSEEFIFSQSPAALLTAALPTAKTLKDFMTEFQIAKELDITADNVGQIRCCMLLIEYNRLQSYELKGSNTDAIAPLLSQEVHQFAAETSTCTHEQQRSHNDFVYDLIKK